MKLIVLTALIVLYAWQTSFSQVKVIDSSTVQMNKEGLRRMVIMLIERESLIETVKAKDMEIKTLERESLLREKETGLLRQSLDISLKERTRPWWNNFMTGALAGAAAAIILHSFMQQH